MNMHSSHNGFILMLTIMFLSIGMLLTSQFFHRGQTQIHLDQVFIDREKAKILALSGIQLAISQLSILDTATTKEQQQGQSQRNPEQEKLQTIVPPINRLQEFILKEKVDGIDGTIQLCIGCEEGKININETFDFKQKKFKGEGSPQGDMRKNMQEIFALLKPFTNEKNLFDVFEKFLKNREYPLNDPTELLLIPEFQENFRDTIFYLPLSSAQGPRTKRPLFLTDIFTTFSKSSMMQPWLLSDSVSALLSLKRAEYDEIKKRAKELENTLKDLSAQQTLEEIWNKQLQPLYGKEFKAIPKEVAILFETKFEPSTFCVLCYGITGAITQKLFAIIEMRKQRTGRADFVIKKLYWL